MEINVEPRNPQPKSSMSNFLSPESLQMPCWLTGLPADWARLRPGPVGRYGRNFCCDWINMILLIPSRGRESCAGFGLDQSKLVCVCLCVSTRASCAVCPSLNRGLALWVSLPFRSQHEWGYKHDLQADTAPERKGRDGERQKNPYVIINISYCALHRHELWL